ncbi:MAG: hypothetical protein QXX29_02350, partial [Nitrososphaerota archaeon]
HRAESSKVQDQNIFISSKRGKVIFQRERENGARMGYPVGKSTMRMNKNLAQAKSWKDVKRAGKKVGMR